MKTSKLLRLIFFVTPVFAQTQIHTELDKEKIKFVEEIERQASFIKQEKEYIGAISKTLEKHRGLLSSLELYEKHFQQQKMDVNLDLKAKLKKLPLLQKIGHKADFYNCLLRSIEQSGYMTYDVCQGRHTPRLNSQEIESLNAMNEVVGKSLTEIALAKESVSKLIESSEQQLNTYQRNIGLYEGNIKRTEDSIKTIELKKDELKLIPKHANIVKCDAHSPVINLEEKEPFPGAGFNGAFYGIPRDNQDGVGSCFANAAKNLLVGVSGGKDVASFLDLALVYKKSTGAVTKDGLDGGDACGTLSAAKDTGYCPQQLSSLETGERNLAGENLFNQEPKAYIATNLDLITEFIRGVNSVEKGGPIKNDVLSNAQEILYAIKNNPDIILPLPGLRFELLENWKLKETHFFHKKSIGISEQEFIDEYNKHFNGFYPKHVSAISDGKSMDQIFTMFEIHLAPFFKKYGIEGEVEEYKRVYKLNAAEDFNDPRLKQKMRASLDFLKKLMNKSDIPDGDFLEHCSQSEVDSFKLLTSVQTSLAKLLESKVNEDLLFDKDGKFKSAAELLQLAVAPSCLNAANRKPLPSLVCNSGYDTISDIKKSEMGHEDQVRQLREKVVLSLVQGYPLGNVTLSPGGGGHINTIVGIRFNPEVKKCEYLIRESQTGTSDWHSESKIFEKISALTEVRKK